MILRRLTIENFRQFPGVHEMDFAPPGDRNVTIILGENGAGKSTLRNAFLWCLYGIVELPHAETLASHRSVMLSDSDQLQVRVSVQFEARGKTYFAERRRPVIRGQPESDGEDEFRLHVQDGGAESTPAPDPQRTIEQILPRQLASFFFFHGEEMERLALADPEGQLKKGVETLLDFEIIDRAERHLKEVSRLFERELGQSSSEDVERIGHEIEEHEQAIADANARVEKRQTDKQLIAGQREKTRQKLEEFEQLRPLFEEERSLEKRLGELKDLISGAWQDLARRVSSDGYLLPVRSALGVPRTLASEAEGRGDLPANIKPAFVDQRVELGECICGQPITDEMRQTLLDWKSTAGLAKLESAILTVRNYSKEYESRVERAAEDISALRTRHAELNAEREQTKGRLSELQRETLGKDFKSEDVSKLQTLLATQTADLREIDVKIRDDEDLIAELDGEIDGLRAERAKFLTEGGELALAQRRFEASSRVSAAFGTLRGKWETLAREFVTRGLTQVWNDVAQLPHTPRLDGNFGLVVDEVGPDGKERLAAPSNANARALALSFVAALVRVCMDASSGANEKSFFQGGEYPLVMDAPFSTMGKDFSRRVPAALREIAPQIVLLSNDLQWGGEVERALAGHIGRAYVTELHRPPRSGQDSDKSVTIGGHTIDFVVLELDASEHRGMDWSIVREVEQ